MAKETQEPSCEPDLLFKIGVGWQFRQRLDIAVQACSKLRGVLEGFDDPVGGERASVVVVEGLPL